MGRTLHFQFEPINGRFTLKELDKLYDVGKIHTERATWTCETFSIEPYALYPSWDKLQADNSGKRIECGDGWRILNRRWDILAKTGLHPNAISRQLVKENIANFHGIDKKHNPQAGFGGFCKTGGNELNSLQVVMGLLAASRVVKNARIKVSDEGCLLRCSLVIVNGKVQPDDKDISASISWLLGAPLFQKEYEDYKDKFMAEAKELWLILHPVREPGISYLVDEWFDAAKFIRPIKAEDFENFPEYNGAQIMAGFNGEYFGLATEDPEAASYRMIALLQKAFEKADPTGQTKLEITPKIKL